MDDSIAPGRPMDSTRLAHLCTRSARAISESAALLARARAAAEGSRLVLEAARELGGGVSACKELWNDLRQLPPPQRTLPVCSVCSRVRTPAWRWTQIPLSVLHRMRGHAGGLPVTPAVCPACREAGSAGAGGGALPRKPGARVPEHA
jgi:hypothetical protein